jgi:D-alanyl-D-alanine carboxypeptidase/D-alanyl-D-alanine-endopeptidase (penicillin-binding protein 4)
VSTPALALAVAVLLAGCGKSDVVAVEPSPAPPSVRPETDAGTLARAARFEAGVRRTVGAAIEEARRDTNNAVHDGNVHVSVHVRERGSALEFGLEDDRPLRPASNMKLLTSAAALLLLGPEWSFETAIEAAGEVKRGVLAGDLVVRAGGDPLYDPEAPGALERFFDPVLADLSAAGIRRVDGNLVLDERGFQEPRVVPGWPEASQHWAEYCALSGGFSVNRGCMTVTVTPGAVGAPAGVSALPLGHGLEPKFSVETVAEKRNVVALSVVGRTLVVRGRFPASASSWTGSCSHPDPVELFGNVFRERLRRAGIEITGYTARVRGVATQRRLTAIRTPLLTTLRPINTESINGVADQVFLATGQALFGAGTAAASARATARALERLGIPVGGLVQVDGSGLSRDNRVTARQMAALIDAVLDLDARTADLYLDSLAVGGETGTLAERMSAEPLRGRVHAKTGFIDGTSSLTGVVDGTDGTRRVFSILVEYPPHAGLNSSCWKPMQDEICALLAGPTP